MLNKFKKITIPVWSRWFIGVIAGALFLAYVTRIFPTVHLDSDYSNLILEANDIVHGNVFLNGWTQTGISFLTTDLLYYVVAVIIKGVRIETYWLASGLMVSAMLFSAIPLLKMGVGEKYRLTEWIVFLGIGAVPASFGFNVLRAHTGVYIWIFLAIACTSKILVEKSRFKLYYILFVISVIMGCMGDAIMYIAFVAPVVLICIRDILSNEASKRKPLYLLILTAGSVALAVVLEKLYYTLGSANKSSFLESKVFEDFSNYGYKLCTYAKVILSLNHADFSKKVILSPETFFYFINTLIVVFAFVIMGIHIYDFLIGRKRDLIGQMISLGFVLISLVLIMTNVAVDILCARYVGPCPVIFALLIVRYLRDRNIFQLRIIGNRVSYAVLAVILSAVLLVYNFVSVSGGMTATYEQEEVRDVLRANGLVRGYANFWDASLTTVLSEGEIQVRPISLKKKAKPFRWGSKKTWYKQEAEFVVVRKPEWHKYGVTYENAVKYLGVPPTVIECGKYKILVYDYDLSQKMNKK